MPFSCQCVNVVREIPAPRVSRPGCPAGDPRELHFYFNGLKVGDISNNGTSDVDYVSSIYQHTALPGTDPFRGGSTYSYTYADFDQSYDPINGLNYESTASRYTVQSGDTLESIALQLWGDASFWYMLADANGLDGSETLVAGMSLIVPNKVHNAHNSSSTWKVYDPNEAIGDTAPTAAKPPKKNKCGAFGQILIVAIAVAVTIIALPASGPITFGQGLLAGAAGSAASQAVGLATGIQDKFDFKGLALSALAGGITAGIGPEGKLFGLKTGANGLFGKGLLAAAGRGMLSSALTQGIGVATGLQDKFNWAGVAAAGIGAGVGTWANANWGLSGFGAKVVPGMAGGIAGAAAESLVTGRDFGDTLMASLPSIIGNTVGGLSNPRSALVVVVLDIARIALMLNAYS